MYPNPHAGYPAPSGLYDPRFEHDACGVSFVASITGDVSHSIVAMGIGALCNMEHRGATGAEADSGDGAGILLQVPHRFLSDVAGFDLPAPGHYAVGLAFLPSDPTDAEKAQSAIEAIVTDEGLRVLGWRVVPTNPDCLGVSRTLVYKGMLTTPQLAEFFPDLLDERVESALALVHSRFSTNTFPSWPLAHPYRFVAHNGEINTVQGNRNWMRTRESHAGAAACSPAARAGLPDLHVPGPATRPASTNLLELLHLGGYAACPTP
jgi:glutamate synthase (NADPH/NADH) large chain